MSEREKGFIFVQFLSFVSSTLSSSLRLEKIFFSSFSSLLDFPNELFFLFSSFCDRFLPTTHHSARLTFLRNEILFLSFSSKQGRFRNADCFDATPSPTFPNLKKSKNRKLKKLNFFRGHPSQQANRPNRRRSWDPKRRQPERRCPNP